jgi:hypothetical protein
LNTGESARPFSIVPPVSQVIDSSGGTVSLGDAAAVSVPAGARQPEDVAQPVQIVQTRTAIAPPAGFQLENSGDVFVFTPHGASFADSITIRLPFEGPQSEVRILRRSGESNSDWQVMTNVWFNPMQPGFVFFKTLSFSVYGVSRRITEVEASNLPVARSGFPTLPSAVMVRAGRAGLVIGVPHEGDHSVSVFRLNGAKVLVRTAQEPVTYHFGPADLPAGMYVVTVKTSRAYHARSVVIRY